MPENGGRRNGRRRRAWKPRSGKQAEFHLPSDSDRSSSTPPTSNLPPEHVAESGHVASPASSCGRGEGSSDLRKRVGVLERLDELSREGAPEKGVSEEEMAANDQLQEDEVLALDGIYGDGVSVFGRRGGLRALQIDVHIEVPEEFKVSVKLQTSGEKLERNATCGSDNSNVFTYNFGVQYLPPVTLTCLFPRLYPSHCPPHFTIRAKWLNALSISILCHMLDNIWNEQPRMEVLYQWVEWLRSSSLLYLGFDSGITLEPCDDALPSVDRRAFSEVNSPEVLISTLLAYDNEKRDEAFRNNLHNCAVCFDENPGTNFIRLPCKHFFCRNCMETYCNLHVKEGSVFNLICPDSKCATPIPHGLLKQLLASEAYDKLESLLLQKTLDNMCDLVYCPRCETACLECEENNAQCPKCYFTFCSLCNGARHVGVTCLPTEARLLILQKRQHSNMIKEDQKLKERHLINELLSVKEILSSCKQCPSCKMAIEKIDGCNKMVCKNCGKYFCFSCNKVIDGYEHFRGSCQLYEFEDTERWEEMLGEPIVDDQYVVYEYENQIYPCPNCRQNNEKEKNNNHVCCWSCRQHYCASCLKIVRNSREHYGPKGCKQHTVDD